MSELTTDQPATPQDVARDAGPATRAATSWLRPSTAAAAGALVAVVLVVGLLAPNQWVDIVNQALIASVGALALNAALGHAGLVSVGNSALLGLGGLTTAQVVYYLDMGFVVAMLAGGAVAAVAGLLIALPSMRIKGLYLAMATLAFHFIAVWFIREVQTAQVGNSGYTLGRANFFGWEIGSLHAWYVFLLAFLGLMLLATRTLLVRKPGRVWRSLREQPAIAAMSGVRVNRYKVWVFVLSSFAIGVAGAVFSFYVGAFSFESYTLHLAIVYLAMVIIGGLGSMYGPIFGAFFMTLLPDLVSLVRDLFSLDQVITGANTFLVQGAVVGLAIVTVIIVEPLGMAAFASRVAARVRRRFGGEVSA